MKTLTLFLLATTITVGSARANDCTVPGALNSAVTQETIQTTICIRGWSKAVRPPFFYTNSIKHRLLPPGGRMSDYELDHCIPIELGGAPRSQDNLWLQLWTGQCGAHAKDVLENFLHNAVCANQMTLANAQKLVTTWCHK